jgi:hypothetical protein
MHGFVERLTRIRLLNFSERCRSSERSSEMTADMREFGPAALPVALARTALRRLTSA